MLTSEEFFNLVSIDENGKTSVIFDDVKQFSSISVISEDGSILYLADGTVSAYYTSNYSKIWTYKNNANGYFVAAQLLLSKNGIVLALYDIA